MAEEFKGSQELGVSTETCLIESFLVSPLYVNVISRLRVLSEESSMFCCSPAWHNLYRRTKLLARTVALSAACGRICLNILIPRKWTEFRFDPRGGIHGYELETMKYSLEFALLYRVCTHRPNYGRIKALFLHQSKKLYEAGCYDQPFCKDTHFYARLINLTYGGGWRYFPSNEYRAHWSTFPTYHYEIFKNNQSCLVQIRPVHVTVPDLFRSSLNS